MFETAILDDRATKSRAWTVAAVGMQLALIGAIVLVPLLAPQTMQLIVRQATITFQPEPLRPLPQQTVASSTPATQSPVSAMTQFVRKVLQAPGRINPVAQIVDQVAFVGSAPSIGTGGPTSPFVPGSIASVGAVDTKVLPPPSTPVAKPEPAKPVRVGGSVLEAKMIKRVVPIYPALAKQARVSGSVRLEGIIAKDGTIQQLRVISGHALLVRAALEAVRQWVYSPTLLNGQAVEVSAPIDVNFVLNN